MRPEPDDSSDETSAASANRDASEQAGAALGAVERMRLLIVCTAMSLLVFSQSSGKVAADTKLDLIVSPARFLHRALHVWDPIGGSGQMQDQAYGYLFPMGPFFVVGKLLSLDPWVTQRCWESALLVVSFLGARRLAAVLGVVGFWPSVVSGLVYALAPRMLTELFSISSELLPGAVLPLVMIPLVKAAAHGPVRSAAMRSGAALLLAGGVNASATLAILPAPAMWLLTRTRGRRRAALMRWWALAVTLSCLWWAVPLVVLGHYSPPFLDWIESASVTTSQNSFVAVARGADHWQAYLGPSVWPAGWIYAVAVAAILATAAVAACGVAGLSARNVPHRMFLVCTLLLGFLLLTVGHRAGIGSPVAGQAQSLLDGALRAFRNIHKFDPLVRLPLAVGAGHFTVAATRAVAAGAWGLLQRVPGYLVRFVAAAVAVCVGAVALSPALTNQLVPQARATVIPGYWSQAADWLDGHSAQGRALVLPGAGRPEMFWGATVDEPMQAVARSPWATRDIVPLGQAGYVRLLDEVEALVATGTPQSALAPLLQRSGIGYLAVRADLAPTADATSIGVVRSALLNSPGLSVVRTFGPELGVTGASNRLIDRGAATNVPAITIMQVEDGGSRASLVSTERAVVANGSSDGLAGLIDMGLSPATPVLFGTDADRVHAANPVHVLTDGLRKREVPFGHPGAVAATLTADQPYQLARPVHDYLPDNAGVLSTLEYVGISDVHASSSGADVAAFFNRGPEHAPWYAVDGDPATAWLSGSGDGAVGQWLDLRLTAPVVDPIVTIRFPALGPDTPTSLVVQTDSGTSTVDVTPDVEPQALRVPAGPTQHVRLTVASVLSGTKGTAAGLAEVTIDGIRAQRALRVPAVTSAPIDAMVFRAAPGYRPGCVAVGSSSACLAGLGRQGEEQDGISRVVTTGQPADYSVAGSLVLTPSAQLNARLDAAAPVSVTASSVASLDPRQRPGAAVDESPGTTWVAADGDPTPTLTLEWATPVQYSSFTMTTSIDAPVSLPSLVEVAVAGHTWTSSVGGDGTVDLPESVTARSMRIAILESAVRVSSDSRTGAGVILPAGVSDIRIPGVAAVDARAPVTLPCGEGPTLDLDGRDIATSVIATREAVLAGQEVEARACVPQVTLAEGEHQLALRAAPGMVVTGLTLIADSGLASGVDEFPSSQILKWGHAERAVHVTTTSQALLVVHENFNAGWRATYAGHRLPAARVDGWQQAFVIPAGADGTVAISYGPDTPFTWGLVVGLAAALLLLTLAMRPSRDASSPGLAGGRPAGTLVWVSVTAVLALTAGAAGVVTAAIALGLGRRPATWHRWIPFVAWGFIAIAGVLNAAGPSVSSHALTNSAACQGAVLAALAVLTIRLSAAEPDVTADE